MEYPKVTQNNFQERAGVLTVALQINNLGLIFRETSNTDVGIDGQVEYVSGNDAIGKLVAVQIKSGKSYLRDKGDHYAFYPEEKHRQYWESFPLPVVLMLHDPDTNHVYFTDARYYLRIPEHERPYQYIPVKKNSVLNEENKHQLFQSHGISESEFLDIPQLLEVMLKTRCAEIQFPVSYFELFVNSLTNLCRHSYFGMSLACEIAEFNLSRIKSEFGMGVNPVVHDFLHEYVRFLIAQNLVRIDYSDFLIDWQERQMQPEFMAPLTSRGRILVEQIRFIEEQLFTPDVDRISVACERFVEMRFAPSDGYRLWKISEFESRYMNGDSSQMVEFNQ